MLFGMRVIVLAVWLAGCTISGGSRRPAAPAQPTEDMMTSAVLDHQDPGADTSHNPELSWSSSRSLLDDVLNGLIGGWSSRTAPSTFAGPAETPHYYKGCRGCSTERSSGAVAVAVAAGLGLRRRRRRRVASRASALSGVRDDTRRPQTCCGRGSPPPRAGRTLDHADRA
jgi:MYXO-CTERM domain-containing protein